jgi:hypothetical protein
MSMVVRRESSDESDSLSESDNILHTVKSEDNVAVNIKKMPVSVTYKCGRGVRYKNKITVGAEAFYRL